MCFLLPAMADSLLILYLIYTNNKENYYEQAEYYLHSWR